VIALAHDVTGFDGTPGECVDHLVKQIRGLWEAFKEEYKAQAELDVVQVERDAVLEAPIGKKPSGEQAGGHHMAQDITHRVEVIGDDVIAMVGIPKDAPSGEYNAFVNFGTGRRGAMSAAFLNLKVPDDYEHPKYRDYNPDWAGMPANPFLFRALNMNRKRIENGRIKALHRAVVRVRGK
jgi:hypothetical protein